MYRKSGLKETHVNAHEMAVAAVAAGLSKCERIRNMTERRVEVYCRLFHHLTGHENYQDAKNDTRMIGNDGIVSDIDDEDKEESGEEAKEDDE